ncbi:MAG TPA: hypothetical protein O0X39_04235 [Methanocorpusculum sp.]|nr:hypothetical protein [Methanocorpusculum sp.]
MPITTKGKLYARLVHDGKRVYPYEIPSELIRDTYDSYTDYYHFEPELVPPND